MFATPRTLTGILAVAALALTGCGATAEGSDQPDPAAPHPSPTYDYAAAADEVAARADLPALAQKYDGMDIHVPDLAGYAHYVATTLCLPDDDVVHRHGRRDAAAGHLIAVQALVMIEAICPDRKQDYLSGAQSGRQAG